jgi:hypothetical protein
MFEITKDRFQDADIPAAIIQKMATKLKVNYDNKKEVSKFIDRKEYKQMLMHVRKGLPDISTR